MNVIPSKIHVIFLGETDNMPDLFTTCYERMTELHPDWEIRWYNDDDAEEFVREHFPAFQPVYNAYPYPVQRADILRIMLMYVHGGFYMDLDIYCLKALDELQQHELVLGEEKTIDVAEKEMYNLRYQQRIGSYMFGSAPYHPFWLEVLKASFETAAFNINSEGDILETTGPGLLTNVYHDHKRIYKGITLLRNTDRDCIVPYHKTVACHFGNFAAHLHHGSWRRNVRENNGVVAMPAVNPSNIFNVQPPAPSCIYLSATAPGTSLGKEMYTALENSFEIAHTAVTGKVVLFLNSANQHIPAGNTNILICVPDIDIPDTAAINTYYQYCIVPGQKRANELRLSGITIPIQVVTPCFYRANRSFHEEEWSAPDDQQTFTIGSKRVTDDLTTACDQLKATAIPGLQLRIGDPAEGMHCFIDLDGHPMESLYLGIPTISQHQVEDFCCVVQENLYNTILDAHQNYESYNDRALDAATRFEDQWTVEKTVLEIVQWLRTIDSKG